MTEPAARYDLAVVGAGPAGLAAAIAGARLGANTLLVNDNPTPGGHLLYRQGGFPGAWEGQLLECRELALALGDAAAQAGVTMRMSTTCWGIFDQGHTLALATPSATQQVTADRLVLATGAADTSVAFPGWTLPGVIGARALSRLLNQHGVLPGRVAVLLGSDPRVVRLLSDWLEAGGTVAALVGPGSERLLPEVEGLNVRAYAGYVVTAVEGEREVTAVRIHLATEGGPAAAVEDAIETDTLIVATGLAPVCDLAASIGCQLTYLDSIDAWVPSHDPNGRTSLEGVYVAGECAGLLNQEVHLASGELAARSALAESPAEGNELRSLIRRAAPPHLAPVPRVIGSDESMVICRCEDVTLGEISRAVALGARSVEEVRRLCRAGMGICQGQICSLLVRHLLARQGIPMRDLPPVPVRPPVRPVPLSVLATPTT